MIFKGLYEEREKEKEWSLRVIDYGNTIAFKAVDGYGNIISSLFDMTVKNGLIHRRSSISDVLGFDLDDRGRIKVKE